MSARRVLTRAWFPAACAPRTNTKYVTASGATPRRHMSLKSACARSKCCVAQRLPIMVVYVCTVGTCPESRSSTSISSASACRPARPNASMTWVCTTTFASSPATVSSR
eukprot:Amastigsp_a761_82.p7 type:complete len:109 gc:universal Amastigsp_a761_82:668-994(+)